MQQGSPSCWDTLSEIYRGISSLVRQRCRLPGLSRVAAVARRLRVSDVWTRRRLAPGRRAIKVVGVQYASSVTAGTIFDRTRTPLTVWFTACWLFTTGKDGISALSLKRVLEIGSYQTAWAMLHRLRSVLVRPGRELLSGTVQVDETYIGGAEPGLAGGRARGKKVLTGIAVEVREPRGLGRCRIAPVADASAESLHKFVMDNVEPGATIITDGWPPYQGLAQLGYVHDRRSSRSWRRSHEAVVRSLCIGFPRWPTAGSWGLTRAPSTTLIWLAISTSSCSASTAGAPTAVAWCFTECSNWPSPTSRCVIRT